MCMAIIEVETPGGTWTGGRQPMARDLGRQSRRKGDGGWIPEGPHRPDGQAHGGQAAR